jgi:negative regulator of flagellin synthesis FlgM
MKVNGNPPNINIEAYLQKVQNKKAPEVLQNGQDPDGVKNDNVILSPKAKEIYEAKKILRECPDINEEKVAEIKKQIEEGTYQIDSKKIAEKLLKDTLLDELL